MPAWAEAALVLASPSPAAASASSSSSCGGVRPRAALESGRLFCKVQGFPCSMRSKAGFQINNYRTRTFKIKAKTESGDGYTHLAPLRFESPSGQLLVQILQSHPHLLPATVDQQLENLQSEKDAQKEEASKVPQDLLYKRIAEVKEKERQNALEEIIYCWVIYKFMDNDISMTPALPPGGGPVRDISSLPNQKDKLQSIHSPDAFEMIQNHLNLIMGEKIAAPLDTVVEISNLNLGKLYAASIMYGYFLKRVDERFQLEKTMKTLPPNPKQQIVFENLKPNPFWDMESLVQITPDGEEISLDDEESSPNKLRSYVSQLDADTLQRYATIRSKEAVSLIEKQTQSLFGRPDIKVLDDGSVNARDGKMITITFIELNHLVLEAVAFGSFLWEAESYVESKYHFVNS